MIPFCQFQGMLQISYLDILIRYFLTKIIFHLKLYHNVKG